MIISLITTLSRYNNKNIVRVSPFRKNSVWSFYASNEGDSQMHISLIRLQFEHKILKKVVVLNIYS